MALLFVFRKGHAPCGGLCHRAAAVQADGAQRPPGPLWRVAVLSAVDTQGVVEAPYLSQALPTAHPHHAVSAGAHLCPAGLSAHLAVAHRRPAGAPVVAHRRP